MSEWWRGESPYGGGRGGGGRQRRGRRQHRGRHGGGRNSHNDQGHEGGARGGRETDDQRERPPPGLRGRAIGMWYANRHKRRGDGHTSGSQRSKDKHRMNDRLTTHEVNLDEGKERHLTNLLANIKTAEQCPPQPSRSYQNPNEPNRPSSSGSSLSSYQDSEVSSSFRRQIRKTPERTSVFSVAEYSQNWTEEGTTPHYIPLDANPLGFDNNHRRFDDEDDDDKTDEGNIDDRRSNENVVDDWSERLNDGNDTSDIAVSMVEIIPQNNVSKGSSSKLKTEFVIKKEDSSTSSPFKAESLIKKEPGSNSSPLKTDFVIHKEDSYDNDQWMWIGDVKHADKKPKTEDSSSRGLPSTSSAGTSGAQSTPYTGLQTGASEDNTPDDTFSDDDNEEMIQMTQEAERQSHELNDDFIPLGDDDEEEEDDDYTEMVPQFRHSVDDNEEDHDMTFLYEFTAHRDSNRSQERLNRYVPSAGTRAVERDPALDEYLVNELQEKETTAKFRKMVDFRKKLPSYGMREEIVSMIASNQVVVLSGETGCGKTTQVPQFILDDYIRRGCGSTCNIVCTQPRRISAISVAERVADERAEQSGDGSVGFQIRLESKLPRKMGSILYCTTGIMLKWLVSDEHLKRVSHIILDEIHERDVLSDFLMIILKDLLPKRRDLKLILMSATLNANMFSQYFGGCPMLNIPGFTFPVEEFYLEGIIDTIKYSPPPTTQHMQRRQRQGRRGRQNGDHTDEEYQIYLRNLVGVYDGRVIKILENYNFDQVDTRLCEQLIAHICRTKRDGAILVFLPGWSDIQNLNKALTANYMFQSSRYMIIPLHSMLPTSNQRQVFDRPPPGVRKIVLATNIAETSITIDDVVYVIDCGKIKMTTLDVKSNLSTLKAEWVSHANAKQRRGRAGRVQAGECYRLYTHFQESKFSDYLLPEMLRTRLEDLCLQIKMLRLGRIEPFIKKAMEPPSLEALHLAVEMLSSINALDENEDLTPLGYHLAKMPVDCQMGKMLLFGAMFCCVDPILTVAASLSYKDPFFLPMGKASEADQMRVKLGDGYQSDHIVLVNAYRGWERAKSRGTQYQFCRDNFLSPSILKLLGGMRQQLMDLLRDMKFVDNNNTRCHRANKNSENTKLVKAVIAAGLYPNVAKLNRMEKKHKFHKVKLSLKPPPVGTMVWDEKKRINVPAGPQQFEFFMKSVNIHTLSFNSKWVVYFEKLKTQKNYILDSTVVPPLPLLFFGGKISTRVDCGDHFIVVDDWIIFKASPKIASIVKDLCAELDKLLDYKITHPGVTNWDGNTKEGALMHAISELLTSESVSVGPGNARNDRRIRPNLN